MNGYEKHSGEGLLKNAGYRGKEEPKPEGYKVIMGPAEVRPVIIEKPSLKGQDVAINTKQKRA